MKRKITSALLLAVLCLGTAGAAFGNPGEPDYSQWNSNSGYPPDVMGTSLLTPVKFLMDRGIITGDADGLFHPEKNISRAEYATMLARATNHTGDFAVAENEEVFTDLAGYGWATDYINAAAAAGLMRGVGDNKFAPSASVTYAEVITALIRMNAGAANIAEGMAPSWPQNYILYAEIYNMKGPVVVRDWNAPAPKGDVARLLHRRMPKTDSASGALVRSVTVDGAAAAVSPQGSTYTVTMKEVPKEEVLIVITAVSQSAMVRADNQVGTGGLRFHIKVAPPFPNRLSFSVQSGSRVNLYSLVINGEDPEPEPEP